jgi:hypothetical protein
MIISTLLTQRPRLNLSLNLVRHYLQAARRVAHADVNMPRFDMPAVDSRRAVAVRRPSPPGAAPASRPLGSRSMRSVILDETTKERAMSDAVEQAGTAQQSFFRVTDNIPEETWYWLALGSIGVSAMLKMMEKDDWALFVGQWPPTFLLFGLYHRLLRPGQD